MFRRALLVAVMVLTACGDDDDDQPSGGPPREGTSAEWADAWTAVATEECGGQCAVFEAIDGATPAADAEPANFNVRYTPDADPQSIGWDTVEDFGAAASCVLPVQQPVERELINCGTG